MNGRSLTSFAFTLAAVLIGYALQISNGHLDGAALLLVTAALLICAAGIAVPSIPPFERRGSRIVFATAAAGLAFQLGSMFFTPPARYLKLPDPQLYWVYLGGLIAAAAVAALAAFPIRPHVWLTLLAAIHFVIGVWTIRMSPAPRVDVFYQQQEACRAIVHGQNPYATTYPNAYAAGARSSGLGYPPLSYLLALPGYLAGDIRYSHLLAMSLAALLFGLSRPAPLSALIAALFLFTPRTFFVLEQSWTEPFVVLLFAATVFCKVRGHHRLLPVCLGLLIASKQHLFLLVPAIALLVGPPFRWKDYLSLLAKAAAAGLAVTLPFLLWNPAAFFGRVLTAYSKLGFRVDSLSYAAWAFVHYGVLIPQWVGFLMSFLALGLALWKLPRSPSGFAAAAAIQYFVLIILSVTAFCNYYYMVLGFLCMAACVGQGHALSTNLSARSPAESRTGSRPPARRTSS